MTSVALVRPSRRFGRRAVTAEIAMPFVRVGLHLGRVLPAADRLPSSG